MKLEKQSSRPLQLTVVVVFVAALMVIAKLANTDPPTNRVQTTPDHEDEALRSRYYNVSLPDAIRAAQSVLREQSTYGRAWKITGYDASEVERQQIHVEVPVIVLTDDLTVQLRHESDGDTRVDCLSVSRVGKADFGENRRHIIQLLAALDGVLG